MSTFLQLAQKLRQECRIAGTGPTTVTGQAGELKDLVDWTADAYTELQNRNGGHWRWLRREFTVNTVADDDTYAPGDCTDVLAAAVIDRFNHWRVEDLEDPPKIYLTADGVGGQAWMVWAPWEWFKQIYKIGTQTSGVPHFITIDPQDNLVIGPKPNGIYTITGEYWRSAQTLSVDADIPEMPAQFHNLITYRAMEKYAGAESAPEVMYRGQTEGRRMLRQLENNQLSKFKKANPLA